MRKNPFRRLKATKFFQTTDLDWVEAGLQCAFESTDPSKVSAPRLQPVKYIHHCAVRTLTKEQKKSRGFGNAFHSCQGILRLVKPTAGAHVRYCRRLPTCRCHSIFAHIGALTGMYGCKHKLMRQVRMAKDLEHPTYYRFNIVWLFFMHGIVPLLEQGSETSESVSSKVVTAKTISWIYTGIDQRKAPGMPTATENTILRYIKSKADCIRRGAISSRRGGTGISRVELYISAEEAVAIYTATVHWLEVASSPPSHPIPSPQPPA
ncbi:hypothetical protein BDM02DRAFT_3188675 [Thelephora ganbajun]|uniref:Uncharacterized protein n=1 Tax=Thelephora ganbajun TaxID=370292 RepID=A0ACB6ZB88_THEGA|nr:hypothetical protein BDM02DRAFT_3188675 [Thelephora ganbajun]